MPELIAGLNNGALRAARRRIYGLSRASLFTRHEGRRFRHAKYIFVNARHC